MCLTTQSHGHGTSVTHPESLEDLTETSNSLLGRFRLPLVLELESYFFNSAVQLRTRLSGAGVSSALMVLVRNFFPSGKTS
jgi:uncharacterized protein (UPF0216 family)